MLVLSRTLHQKLHLFDTDSTCICTISIQAIEGGRVRVGVDAGEKVLILRGELLNLEQRESAEKQK